MRVLEREETMSFADAMRKDGSFTRTENGAVALNTTGDARLDLFGTIGSLRETDEGRIETLFAEAYNQDALFATKIAFYARDIRGGLGERKTFRTIIRYMAEKHPEALRPNLDLIGVFGRYDDLYELIGTPLEDDMWAAMKKQFEEDLKNLDAGERVRTISNLLQYVTPKIQSVSPEELLEKEMQEIRELLFDFPENMIDRVAEKVKELKKIESKNE